MTEPKHLPLVIVGGGPAGLTAAIYAVRSGIAVRVLERGAPGGQMFMIDRIENYPGFPEGISGPELSDRMRDQALRLGAEIVQEEVKSIEPAGERKRLVLAGGELTADAVIVATGSRPRRLGVPGEVELLGRGVSYCAVCDGNFFRGQRVAVVGGGNSAVQEASMLARLASQVYIIHRRDRFRAEDYLCASALGQPGVTPLFDTVVERIEGSQGVEALALKNVKTGERARLPVEGVFIYVGVNPISELVSGLVELTADGYIRAGEDCRTTMAGIYAAGDIRSKQSWQIATAVGDGVNAVRSIELDFIVKGLSGKYV
jgi:thioredoxin reductase (NADPH)